MFSYLSFYSRDSCTHPHTCGDMNMYISAHIYGFGVIFILPELTCSTLINILFEFTENVVFFTEILRAFLFFFSLSLKFCIVFINYFPFSLHLLGLFCFHVSDPSINTILRNLVFNILLRPSDPSSLFTS